MAGWPNMGSFIAPVSQDIDIVINEINPMEGDAYIFNGNVTLHRSSPMWRDDSDDIDRYDSCDSNFRIAIVFSYVGKHKFQHSNHVSQLIAN